MLAPAFLFALGRIDGVLTQEMLNSARNSFVINSDYTLLGNTVVVPDGLTLVFSGGSVDHGELRGSNSKVSVKGSQPVFGLDIKISGTWDVPEVHDGWFAFNDAEDFASNQIIHNILAFSNDEIPCHIFFEEKRTYYFELPYKGRTDLANLLSFKMVDGKKKRNYSELNNDEYAYLRIFTIPSNTHLTVNNTLKMLPTNQGAYFVFWEYGKEKVIVDGVGTIAGDNDWHRYDSPFLGKNYFGEWGHVFCCLRCNDFSFKDITVSDAFGDCIYYSGSYYPHEKNSRWASNLTIQNVRILRARRNGVVIGARNVRITGCYFEGCGTDEVKGTAPKSAIDFEADEVASFPVIGNRDVVMENCVFENNFFDLASSMNTVPGYGKLATTIKNCRFTSQVKIRATYWMRFENCYIPFLYKKNGEAQYYSKHMEFVNCEFGEDEDSAIGHFSKATNVFTNCKFNLKKK
ncbi:hypothetical protein SAMN06298214_0451 [Bacteroidales bacterium WCE2004]|nr:hypothetical protein SAMN06298214_0451 [Bacteroidales bacterium WCE2004]